MKCLNLYAVFGDDPKRGALVHLPVFQDDNGVQYIYVNGDFSPLANHTDKFIRTEPANLGN